MLMAKTVMNNLCLNAMLAIADHVSCCSNLANPSPDCRLSRPLSVQCRDTTLPFIEYFRARLPGSGSPDPKHHIPTLLNPYYDRLFLPTPQSNFLPQFQFDYFSPAIRSATPFPRPLIASSTSWPPSSTSSLCCPILSFTDLAFAHLSWNLASSSSSSLYPIINFHTQPVQTM
jgi:hypothetical protein